MATLPDSLVAMLSGQTSAEDMARTLYDDNLHPPSDLTAEIEAQRALYDLNEADLLSNTWKKIRAQAHCDLITLRIQNDNPKLGPVDTAELRGKINQVKALLAMDKTTSQQADSEELDPNPGY